MVEAVLELSGESGNRSKEGPDLRTLADLGRETVLDLRVVEDEG